MLAPEINLGGKKRKAPTPARCFPRPFYAYNPEEHTVLGVFLPSECSCLSGSDELYWRVDRWVPFARPERVETPEISWASTISHLLPGIDHRFRSVEAAVGGAMRAHFLGFEGERWHLWPVTASQRHAFETQNAPLTMPSAYKFAKAVGVEPQVVRLAGRGLWAKKCSPGLF